MAYKDNSKFYKKAFEKHGISARGVHWNSTFTQYKRFEILTNFIKDEIKTSFIIDAGCGFAEYYNYLIRNNKEAKNYLGIDCEKMMINVASKRFPNIDFKVQNILEDDLLFADYYICSGAMNILEKKDVFSFIEKCFFKSNKGFIFNFLKNDSLCKVDHIEVINFCKKLTKNIEFKDSYLPNDFSIFLKK